jgi:5-methyltetrahydrofolate--homocysteine methyltransferase
VDYQQYLKPIYDAVLDGNAPSAQSGVKAALDAGVPAEVILKESLISSMAEVGRLFEENEYFVPEMLVSARAMQSGLTLLKPLLAESGAQPAGRVVIGTVKGDLHDIGKNLVAMMLEGAGFEVIDLGTDVSPEKFVKAVVDNKASIIGMSALLTTTMPYMKVVIDTMKEKGMREDYIVLVGGAPLNEDFAKAIGADAYCRDAAVAVETAKSYMARKHNQLASN